MKNKNIIGAMLLSCIVLVGCSHSAKQKEAAGTSSQPVTETASEKDNKNTAAQILAKPEVPVLCYHRIADGKKSEYSITPATFSAHMKVLADSGYHSVSPAQVYDYLVYNKELPAKPVMITFDDSRSEHFAIAAPVMEKHGFRGAFFIMTITYNKKNYMTTDQIAQLAKKGHTIGLHSWDHTMVIKYKDAVDWKKEVAEPKKKLEKIVGMPVEYWAYPNGVYNHTSALEMSKYCKLSFSLFSKRDTILPLQCVRRIIVPDMAADKLLKSMRRAFKNK
jgi:peptidoglycan/xylan/chitin deacetylase (PgdA/CDA1 family)/outer membrane murein-binding lipoprotein Lpp